MLWFNICILAGLIIFGSWLGWYLFFGPASNRYYRK